MNDRRPPRGSARVGEEKQEGLEARAQDHEREEETADKTNSMGSASTGRATTSCPDQDCLLHSDSEHLDTSESENDTAQH